MIHVSGFLKLAYTGDKDSGEENNHGCVTVTSSNVNNYQVIGLVTECHLIESPVIMELSVQHSSFSSAVSIDLKFTSVDTRCALYRITVIHNDFILNSNEYIFDKCLTLGTFFL